MDTLLLFMPGFPLRTRRPEGEGKPPRRFDAGRACRRCGTPLSVYNSSVYCYIHQPVRYPFLRRAI